MRSIALPDILLICFSKLLADFRETTGWVGISTRHTETRERKHLSPHGYTGLALTCCAPIFGSLFSTLREGLQGTWRRTSCSLTHVSLLRGEPSKGFEGASHLRKRSMVESNITKNQTTPIPKIFPQFHPLHVSSRARWRAPGPISLVDKAATLELDQPCSIVSPWVLPTPFA